MSSGIFNAKVVKWWIKRSESFYKEIELSMELKSTDGSAVYSIPIKDIVQLFNVLQINNINELQNCSCVVLIENNYFRTIGNFLATYKSRLHDDWMYSEKYENLILNYYKESGRHPNI